MSGIMWSLKGGGGYQQCDSRGLLSPKQHTATAGRPILKQGDFF